MKNNLASIVLVASLIAITLAVLPYEAIAIEIFSQPSGEIDYPIADTSGANMTGNMTDLGEQSIPIANTTGSDPNSPERNIQHAGGLQL